MSRREPLRVRFMRAKTIRRAILETMEPVGVRDFRAARRYVRSHGLSCGVSRSFLGYRRARRFGLHLLPPGLGLAGLVVDVGANRGDFAAAVRQLESRSRVLCIEPVPANASALRRRFEGDPSITVSEVAASDQDGAAILHVTDTTELSSLLRPGKGLSDYGAAARVIEEVDVTTTTLDALVTSDVLVLKVDVQGHEAAVLRGAERTLGRTNVVLIEATFRSHYEGDATFADVDYQMKANGFDLAGVGAPTSFPGPLLWCDACYIRRRGSGGRP